MRAFWTIHHVWNAAGAVWKYKSIMTHECCRFCPIWSVWEKQRNKRLKINHCLRATYIKLNSSFRMCFVHYIYVRNVHLYLTLRYVLWNVIYYGLPKQVSVVELCHNGISYVKNSGQKQEHRGFLVVYYLESRVRLFWKLNVKADMMLCQNFQVDICVDFFAVILFS